VDRVVGFDPFPFTFDELGENEQSLALVKRERIPRLRLDVHAHHFEPRPVVAHRTSSRSTKQIE
jgi:hypothetical protein